MSHPVLVNVGCGRVWHRDWVNLDHRPASPEVRAFDIRRPLPFGDGTVDAVYASHVLEHLDLADGLRLLVECRRILKPGGIVRIVVPDLEDLCRFYLHRLSVVTERPGADNELAYDWAHLGLIDQHVRRRPGGDLAACLDRPGLLSNPALDGRLSQEVQALLRERTSGRIRQTTTTAPRSMRGAVRKAVMGAMRTILPRSFMEAFETALFLRTGEVHRAAYDRFSMTRLLRRAGFDGIAIVGPSKSAIAGFSDADLDCAHGVPRKPGSLFVEAVRSVSDDVVRMAPQPAVRDFAA